MLYRSHSPASQNCCYSYHYVFESFFKEIFNPGWGDGNNRTRICSSLFLDVIIFVIISPLSIVLANVTHFNFSSVGSSVNGQLPSSYCQAVSLKLRLRDTFCLNWFSQKKPSKFLINYLKYFRFQFQICQDIQIPGQFA